MPGMRDKKFKTVDGYISALPPEVKRMVAELREIITQTAPEAVELISYNMPAFKFHGILVYFAAHKEHVGFYPGSSTLNELFRDELKGYRTSKGTIQFPFGKKVPKQLVKRIVKTRMKQNLEKQKAKLKRSK